MRALFVTGAPPLLRQLQPSDPRQPDRRRRPGRCGKRVGRALPAQPELPEARQRCERRAAAAMWGDSEGAGFCEEDTQAGNMRSRLLAECCGCFMRRARITHGAPGRALRRWPMGGSQGEKERPPGCSRRCPPLKRHAPHDSPQAAPVVLL
jgi:hypothetical protein